MARIIGIGFELNSATNLMELTSFNVSGAGANAISSATFRSGAYALRSSNAGASGLARAHHLFTTTPADGPYFARSSVYIADLPASLISILAIWDGTTLRASIRVATDGTLELHDSGGKIGSSSSALSLNTWYTIELKYFSNGTSTELEGRLNGVSFASTAASSNSGTVDRVAFGMISASTAYDIYTDDIALNDSTGSSQNSFPGLGELIHLRPNANGDNTDFDADDAPNNYLSVDDVTPDENSTSAFDNVLNQIDDYNIDATPAGMDSTDTISCVQIGMRYRVAVQTGDDPGFVLRIKASASGTVEESAEMIPTLNTWNTHATANPRNPHMTLYDLPGASTTAWTKSDLDSAQIGVRVSTADTHLVDITAIWLLVDHTPNLGGTVTRARAIMTTSTKFFGA